MDSFSYSPIICNWICGAAGIMRSDGEHLGVSQEVPGEARE
jgi:hypothetical protein